MGTWGENNFDNDDAGDYLDSVLEKMFVEIQAMFQPHAMSPAKFLYEGDYKIIPALDIYGTLLIHYDGYPDLELETLQSWKREYMDIFEQDNVVNPPAFKEKRRIAILETFARLENYLTDWNKSVGDPE